MIIENISFSMKVNIGNYGETISIMQTASVPSQIESYDNQEERDLAYRHLVDDCILKMKNTVSLLKREKETLLFQNLSINGQKNNVSSNIEKEPLKLAQNSISIDDIQEQQTNISQFQDTIQELPNISQFQAPIVAILPSIVADLPVFSMEIPPVDLDFKVDIPTV